MGMGRHKGVSMQQLNELEMNKLIDSWKKKFD